MDEPDLNIDTVFQCLKSCKAIAIAVSGGADSMALMHLAQQWRHSQSGLGRRTPAINILTVDHALRSQSQHEVQWVKQQAENLGLQTEILKWCGDKPSSSLQEKAREARYRLMIDWCHSNNVSVLLTAHHLDDQAETVLMRLARGSGIDGLGGIPENSVFRGIKIIRPLLHIPKTELIRFLKSTGATWIEDPSNENLDYERVRIRKSLPGLEDLGIEATQLARTAKRMQRAGKALEHYTRQALLQCAELRPEGYAIVDNAALFQHPEEIGMRCLTGLLEKVGGKTRPPAMSKVESLYKTMVQEHGGDITVGGCIISKIESRLIIAREMRRDDLQKHPLAPGTQITWDNRFHITVSPGAPSDLYIRLLTEQGYLSLPREALRETADNALAFSKIIRQSLPSFWIDDRVVWVPHLGFADENMPDETIKIEFIGEFDHH